ncbi:MAG: AraC family transcriptional regulator [Nostoc sp.]|uniref:helix-turn-helix transcriptional regulator n=1 Tax=Nostoc sp. TaxID=1180 RepID=UPI002FFA1ECC
MTLTISGTSYLEELLETKHTKRPFDPFDPLDVLWQYPSRLGNGQCRIIQLREGLGIMISNIQFHDDLIARVTEPEHGLEFTFFLSGTKELRSTHEERFTIAGAGQYFAGQYFFSGSGTAPQEICERSAKHYCQGVNIEIDPKLFCSFTGDPFGELQLSLKHLIRQTTQEYYARAGTITPAMQIPLRQILHCPYQGLNKRLYLESKVLELMALVIEQELEIRNSNENAHSLKPDVADRIYRARELLLQRLDNPPTLMELAQQVELNSRTLKEGFRQVFGKPAFSYLHDYRLEQARQLLEAKEMKVTEVANAVGFGNSYFAKAFSKKFGLTPKLYQKQWKKFL